MVPALSVVSVAETCADALLGAPTYTLRVGCRQRLAPPPGTYALTSAHTASYRETSNFGHSYLFPRSGRAHGLTRGVPLT